MGDMYTVTLSKKADKTLRRMPRNPALNNAKKIRQLAQNPHEMQNVKKLTDTPGYRLRVGDWRIVYTVNDNDLLIHVINVKIRGEVYK
jgi:mRNA interferase RelE/StbE